MRSKRFLWLLVLWLALASVAWSDGIGLTIDRPEATVEDQLVLTVTIEGSRNAKPELPQLTEFDLQSRGQSTQMSFVNGRVTSTVSYTYVLMPRRPGSFTIGPATVELDGETYASNSIEVRILEASEQPRQSRDLFLTTKVSTTKPYVGQEVIYIWRFYRRVRIGDAQLEPQDFEGFLVEGLGDVREYQATVNGVQYLVSEIRKSLFPQEAGNQVIAPSRLTCEVVVRSQRSSGSVFDDFFGTARTETKVLRSRQIELVVQPLPPAPANFGGLVGDFDIAAQISQANLQVGESATLKLTVNGRGNVQMIHQPTMPELASFKVYDDKPSGEVDRSGSQLSGYRTFSKALVPLEPGSLTVPPVALTFFDPEAGSFRTASTAPIVLEVRPGSGQEDLNLTESLAPTTGKVAVRILADDLLPVHRGLDSIRTSRVTRGSNWLLMLGLILPAMAFVGLFAAQRRQERYAADKGLRKRHQARRQAKRVLKGLAKPGADERETAHKSSLCLRQYIGDKLGLEGSALTPAEVDTQLLAHGVEPSLTASTRDLLEQLEAAQYGVTNSSSEAQILERLESLINKLERQIQ